MDVTVESVSFRGKEATATIAFRPRGGDPKQSITMSYSMEKQGDEWHVKGRDMQRHQAVQPRRANARCSRADPSSGHMPWRPATAARPSRRDPMKVAVLGGGPSGAFAAERLAAAGVDTLLFDEKLAWEKPCGGGLTWKAYSQYPFLV